MKKETKKIIAFYPAKIMTELFLIPTKLTGFPIMDYIIERSDEPGLINDILSWISNLIIATIDLLNRVTGYMEIPNIDLYDLTLINFILFIFGLLWMSYVEKYPRFVWNWKDKTGNLKITDCNVATSKPEQEKPNKRMLCMLMIIQNGKDGYYAPCKYIEEKFLACGFSKIKFKNILSKLNDLDMRKNQGKDKNGDPCFGITLQGSSYLDKYKDTNEYKQANALIVTGKNKKETAQQHPLKIEFKHVTIEGTGQHILSCRIANNSNKDIKTVRAILKYNGKEITLRLGGHKDDMVFTAGLPKEMELISYDTSNHLSIIPTNEKISIGHGEEHDFRVCVYAREQPETWRCLSIMLSHGSIRWEQGNQY